MSEEQLRLLQRQLWNIANTLRGKMNADEFRDYILGFIFYKYLSEKFVAFANDALSADKALLHKLRFRHKLPLPDNGLKDTLSDWRTQMSETV